MLDFLFYGPRILRKIEELSMKLSNLDEVLGLVGDTLVKAKAEILAKQDELLASIAALEEALANQDVELTPESEAALARVTQVAQEIDDIVPDPVPVE
jgi:hypothetical protein